MKKHAEFVVKEVLKYMEEAKKSFPVTEELDPEGIFYMNGNDTTEFDWNVNDRLCEFIQFYATDIGYVKVLVYKNGCMEGYVFLNHGRARGLALTPKYLTPEEVYDLYCFCRKELDGGNIWDRPISLWFQGGEHPLGSKAGILGNSITE